MDDCLVEGHTRIWSIIFYRCECGAEKARMFDGAVEIEDLS